MDLLKIKNPKFIDKLDHKGLTSLSSDIRSFLIDSISKTGGHLSSNLGIVETTIALHKVFDSPNDKLIFDVGHQSYVHKILTGRAPMFPTLRKFNGLSGFQKRSESKHDVFESGHASNSISAAAGYAMSRDIDKRDNHVIAIIGDSSLQGGMALEALNHIADTGTKVIIILNDNGMSISKNVGVISKGLNSAKVSHAYRGAKKAYKAITPTSIVKLSGKVKDGIKNRFQTPNTFETMGIDYIGPVNGHSFHALERALIVAKDKSGPVIVHIKTIKGKGYKLAEDDSTGKWHGTPAFDIKTGKPLVTNELNWSTHFSNLMMSDMKKDKNVVLITPAMSAGSKLDKLFEKYPNRTFDTGITEGHAMTFAAGLALGGKKPILSIYSSFFNRAYDQFNQDVSRMNLNVTLLLDRAGIVGEDGGTHHGLFDTGLIFGVPNSIMVQPSNVGNSNELYSLLKTIEQPKAIRLARGAISINESSSKVTFGKWIKEIDSKSKTTIVAYGPVVEELRNKITKNNINVNLVNALFLKPFDNVMMNNIVLNSKKIIFVDTVAKANSLLGYIDVKKGCEKIIHICLPDKFIEHGNTAKLNKKYKIDVDSILKLVK